jgi:exosome complex component RRP45
MNTSGPYVAVRDDSGVKSLSSNEREFLRSCALSPNILRVDGRRGSDIRKVRMQLGRWDNGAECTVQWGVGTRVTSLCSADLVPPSPDRPNEGMVNFTVDLSPMAGTSFRQAPPVSTAPALTSTTKGPNFSDHSQRLLSNRILRSIERIILIGGALDTEALVLMPGKWVWRFTIALTVIDDGGNILDACILAAMAALRHYRKPQVDFSGEDEQDSSSNSAVLPTMIPSIVKEATPLPLHHTPLSISFALIPADDAVSSASSTSIVAALVDPTDREELVQFGNLTIAMNVHSEVCLLDYGGGCELTPTKLKDCWKVADTSIKELCHLLEGALKEADDQAQKERLKRLQRQQHGDLGGELPLPPPVDNTPYFQQTGDSDELMDVPPTVNPDQIQKAETEAEEAYRHLALDYSRGHVATALRDDDSGDRKSAFKQQAGSLLAAMLKSVSQEIAAPTKPNPGQTQPMDQRSSSNGKAVTTTAEPQATVGMEHAPKDKPDTSVFNMHEQPSNDKPDQVPMKMDIDDDEEEAPAILHSEFVSLPEAPTAKKEELKKEPTAAATEASEPDIADLSMAIKKKKKKSKKK